MEIDTKFIIGEEVYAITLKAGQESIKCDRCGGFGSLYTKDNITRKCDKCGGVGKHSKRKNTAHLLTDEIMKITNIFPILTYPFDISGLEFEYEINGIKHLRIRDNNIFKTIEEAIECINMINKVEIYEKE